MENARLEKELVVAQDMAHSRAGNNKLGRKSRPASRGREAGSSIHDDTESFSLDLEDVKMELQARKQREAILEATLAEKELLEEEYTRKFDEAKKRELALENDLAGMWVLVNYHMLLHSKVYLWHFVPVVSYLLLGTVSCHLYYASSTTFFISNKLCFKFISIQISFYVRKKNQVNI